MRVLLSTIGSRGDVQPMVALATQLKTLGQEVHLCVPPDFEEWIVGLGMTVTPIGPRLRPTGKSNPMGTKFTPEQRRQLIEGSVAAQFETVGAAAKGCDVIVGATALQIAAPSIAEHLGVPYVFTAFCPNVLPSPRHAPPVLHTLGDVPTASTGDHRPRWDKDAQRWNDMWAPILAPHRAALGLSAVHEVRDHIHTGRPWLAADRALAPWPDPDDRVFQTGAWILPDTRSLSDELQRFLDAGDPPIYFGFGSISAPQPDLSQVMIQSARALGRRAIISRGWAELSLMDDASDCLAVGDVNQQALFPRTAAVVHHGGAGTTTAAARAGAPQVVIPQHYDQHYWAWRVEQLGIGKAHDGRAPSVDSLTAALQATLEPGVAARARKCSADVRTDGTRVAAEALMSLT